MQAARIAVAACGCVWMMAAAKASQTAEDVELQPAPNAQLFGGRHWVDVARYGTAEPGGWNWRIAAGAPEGLHKIVGFWPSIHWLSPANADTSIASLGYTWRNLRLEGALIRGRDGERRQETEYIKIDSLLKRLAFQPAPNLSFRVSRGYRESPDLIGQPLARRRTASLSYRTEWARNTWNTTLAWSKGAGSPGTSGDVYLLESAVRLARQHTLFGRLERAGNDELFRNEPAPSARAYDANKYTLGYVYDVVEGRSKIGIGGLAYRRSVPDELLPYYGNGKTSYMLFMRFQMELAQR